MILRCEAIVHRSHASIWEQENSLDAGASRGMTVVVGLGQAGISGIPQDAIATDVVYYLSLAIRIKGRR